MADEYVKHVCRFGQAEKQCRYLGLKGAGFKCRKVDPQEKGLVDVSVHKSKARGDCCPGKVDLA